MPAQEGRAMGSLMVEGCREGTQGARRTLTPPRPPEVGEGEKQPRRVGLQSGWKAAGVLGKWPGHGQAVQAG